MHLSWTSDQKLGPQFQSICSSAKINRLKKITEISIAKRSKASSKPTKIILSSSVNFCFASVQNQKLAVAMHHFKCDRNLELNCTEFKILCSELLQFKRVRSILKFVNKIKQL